VDFPIQICGVLSKQGGWNRLPLHACKLLQSPRVGRFHLCPTAMMCACLDNSEAVRLLGKLKYGRSAASNTSAAQRAGGQLLCNSPTLLPAPTLSACERSICSSTIAGGELIGYVLVL
jgi:hypothetical protein